MYKCINGWTKEKMLEVANNRKFTEPATAPSESMVGENKCVYLAKDGNKCAVGDYIPDGHLGQEFQGDAENLLYHFPDLIKLMPLDYKALCHFQRAHDKEANDKSKTDGNATRSIIEWINKNVE